MMSQTTNLLGKDAPLEQTLVRIQTRMEALGAPLKIQSNLQSVPHCYSNHIKAPAYPLFFSNGKGKTDLAAQCSGFAEYVERLGSGYFFIDYALPENDAFVYAPDEQWIGEKMDCLSKSLWSIYDSGDELIFDDLLDFCSDNFDGIACLPFECAQGESAYFPVNLLHHLYASNGLSAGNTLAEAQVQGLSEVFERAIKNRILAQGVCLPDVPKSVLDDYPTLAEGVVFIRAQGYQVWVKDASLGGKYPVACIAVKHPETGGVFVNFGAHPKFEVAFERTLTEILQGRTLEAIADFPSPSESLNDVADEENLILHFIDSSGLVSTRFFESTPDFKFVPWQIAGDTQTELNALLSLIEDEGYTAYLRSNHRFGLWVSQIVVPGFSEVYPMDSLLIQNHNIGKWLRAPIQGLAELTSDARENLAEHLMQYCNPDQRVSELIGLALLPDSPWHHLRVGALIDLLQGSDIYTHFTQATLEEFKCFGEDDYLGTLFDAHGQVRGSAEENLAQFYTLVYQRGWLNESMDQAKS